MLGRNLKGGEVIELAGDVGAGKTSFVRGLAKGAGSDDEVASPSFTLCEIYKMPHGKSIEHYDFYRLNEPGIMTAELAESVNDSDTTVVIEWADIVEGVLPESRLKIVFEVGDNENSRNLTMITHKDLEYLLRGF